MTKRGGLEDQHQLTLFSLFEDEVAASMPDLPVRYEWTDMDVARLREGILIESLRSLGDGRQGEENRQETMSWIMSDDIAPFSFVVCCRSEGLIPERVRGGVNAMLLKQKQFH